MNVLGNVEKVDNIKQDNDFTLSIKDISEEKLQAIEKIVNEETIKIFQESTDARKQLNAEVLNNEMFAANDKKPIIIRGTIIKPNGETRNVIWEKIKSVFV